MKIRVIKKRLKKNGFYMFSQTHKGHVYHGFGDDDQALCALMARQEFLRFLRENPYYIK